MDISPRTAKALQNHDPKGVPVPSYKGVFYYHARINGSGGSVTRAWDLDDGPSLDLISDDCRDLLDAEAVVEGHLEEMSALTSSLWLR
tara:strand:+ start:822 stop:1085 length:264 start_codon:yes stop_codon:yes gene_type:complete